MTTGKTLAVLSAAAAACLAIALVPQSKDHIPVGETAPAFELQGADGKQYALKDLTGKQPVFVLFWKERCPHNGRASALYNNLFAAYAGKVQFLGVVTSTVDGAKKWAESFGLKYPLLSDSTRSAISAFQLKKSICVIEIGTDGKIAAVYPGYGADSLNALNQALAKAAGTSAAQVDLSSAPGGLTWG